MPVFTSRLTELLSEALRASPGSSISPSVYNPWERWIGPTDTLKDNSSSALLNSGHLIVLLSMILTCIWATPPLPTGLSPFELYWRPFRVNHHHPLARYLLYLFLLRPLLHSHADNYFPDSQRPPSHVVPCQQRGVRLEPTPIYP